MEYQSDTDIEDSLEEEETLDKSYDEEVDDENDDATSEILPIRDYALAVTKVLSTRQFVSAENALALNRLMQMKLCKLRLLLLGLLQKCKHRYSRNEEFLQHFVKRAPQYMMPTFRVCGAPYFRDENNFAAPLNEDYINRTKNKKEMFPIDLRFIVNRYWTVKDKCCLVRAIKSQVLDYLRIQFDGSSDSRIPKLRTTQKNIELHTIPLAILLRKVDENFQISWSCVSNYLKNRHSDKTCYAMWYGYMQPDLSRADWTKNENAHLMSVAEKHNFQNWINISKEVPHRSEYQCFLQFQNTVNLHMQSNRKWTQLEDQQLLRAVEANKVGGMINWNKVTSLFQNRSKKTLYTRFKNVLDPDIKKGPFTREEDCILLAAVEEYGENFNCIPMSLFPNRNRVQVRNRYLNSIKYNTVQRGWSVDDDEKLIEFVKVNGTAKWSEISKILKVHTRQSCRTRYTVITKFLTKNPNATVNEIPRKNKKSNSDINLHNWIDKIYELKTKGDLYAEGLAKRKEKYRKMLENRSTNYRDRLGTVSRDFYELFKYSYYYKFGEEKEINFTMVDNVRFLLKCLHFKLIASQMYIRRTSFTVEEFKFFQSIKREKQRKDNEDSIVPANWCTLLGLRAVSILINSDKYAENVMNIPIKSRKLVEAENIFKERFFNIFYQTALLSKFDTNIIEKNKNITTFIVKYLPSTSTTEEESIVEELVSTRKRNPPIKIKLKNTYKKQKL